MAMPKIGVVGHLNREETYMCMRMECFEAILHWNGLPVMLPYGSEPALSEMVEMCDGFLFPGGVDVEPMHFGETTLPECGECSPQRDETELALIRAAYEAGKPMLGICRGIQMLNVALGGTLYQDIPTQYHGEPRLQHHQKMPERCPSHLVTLQEGSRLRAILGSGEACVNSLHHQAVCKLAPGLLATGLADDGLIEGIEAPQHPFLVGVQWHPERMWREDSRQSALFCALVEACKA